MGLVVPTALWHTNDSYKELRFVLCCDTGYMGILYALAFVRN